jgi:TolA-binding protein
LRAILPNSDFVAALMSGLGRIAFVQKTYADAERWYGDVVARFGQSHLSPAAMYWRAVSQYSARHDHTVLGKVAEELRSTYPSTVWASKAIPWLH